MKKSIWITLVIASFPCILLAQSPAPEPDTLPDPVKQGDPAVNNLPPRLDYIEDRKRIKPEEVPEPVRQTLESDALYRNWRQAALYRDENKDEYIVEFEERGTFTTHRFDKEGRPIVKEK